MRFLLLDLLMDCINPFVANVHILYPLKTPENLRFSVVLREYKMGIFARNGPLMNRQMR